MTDAQAYYDRYWTEGVAGWQVSNSVSEPLAALLRAHVTGKKVIDFGGGRGERYGQLIRGNASVYAVADVSREVLKIREGLGDQPIHTTELAEHREKFDALVCMDVLEHLLDPVGSFRPAVEALRPGGTALVAVPNAFSWKERARMLTGRLPAHGAGASLAGRHHEAPHIRFFDVASLRTVLTECGLTVEGVVTDQLALGDRFSRWGIRPVSDRGISPLVSGLLIAQATRPD